MAQSRDNVRQHIQVKEGLANSSHTYFQPLNKDRATIQRCGNPYATAMPKAEKCRWGPNCPICKNIEEDWDGDHQKQIQQNIPNAQA